MEPLKSILTENIIFDWSLDPMELRDIYKTTDFDSKFYNLISKSVIGILTPPQGAELHNVSYDKGLIYQHLLGPLEKFICDLDDNASQEDVMKVFGQFQALNQPSQLCRRILKCGDVTFTCSDCGVDGTCVFCIDCFHKSAHKDHNYKMSSSDGGGCCDCGDIEAWKRDYACATHMAPNRASVSYKDYEDIPSRLKQVEEDKKGILDKISRLPGDTAIRYFLVCQACLHYVQNMLRWENKRVLPNYLSVRAGKDEQLSRLLAQDSSSNNFFTVLYNDEVHTYDNVINTLMKVIRCSKLTASIMASTISREGSALVYNGCLKTCKMIKSSIRAVRDTESGPLKVKVAHRSLIAHQNFAILLIEWIRTMASINDAFRILTAYTLLGDSSPAPVAINQDKPPHDKMTLLEGIMLSNTLFLKIARVRWNDLFFTSLLAEYSIKEKFARLITRIYPLLISQFIQDDHDHSVSILTMTTQLYTVQSLIPMLIEEEDALSIITHSFIDVCRTSKRDRTTNNFENRNTFDMQALKRGFCMMSDLKYLISFKPTKWTDRLIENVIQAVRIFLGLLESMQGLDSVRRQLGQHLEYEPDWESGMTLQSRLVDFITQLVNYCGLNEQVQVAALKDTQTRLIEQGNFKMVTRELYNHQVACIQCDVSTSPISVHLPLTRFAAALILDLMRRRPCGKIPYDESLVMLADFKDEDFDDSEDSDKLKHAIEPQSSRSAVKQNIDNSMDCESSEMKQLGTRKRRKFSLIDIMEPALRTEVMIAQFRSGMWRRNGFSLVNQILYFHNPMMRKEMFDRDILVLQECAATCEANEFIIHLMNKYQLFNWIDPESHPQSITTGPKGVNFINDEDILAQSMSLGEEFLQLLITIISERYRVGVGMIAEEDVLMNEVIQLLCISRSTRSELSQRLHVNDIEIECLKKVATLRRSTEASTGKYELKDEFHDRFNPFFYHYNRRQQSNALNAQLKRKKTLKEPLICCPPPAPVELTEQFRNLNNLLKSDILLIVIQKNFERALDPPETNKKKKSAEKKLKFRASDLQVDQCLHLVGLGLFEQERKPIEFPFIQAAHDKRIFKLLQEFHDQFGRSKDLVFWLIKKTSDLIENLNANHSASLDEDTTRKLSEISGYFQQVLSSHDSTQKDGRKWSSEMAAQRRERIMAMMKAKQDKFLSNPSTKQLVAETEKNERPQPKNRITTSSAAGTSSLRDLQPRFGCKSFRPMKCISSDQSEGPSPATTSLRPLLQDPSLLAEQLFDVDMFKTGSSTTGEDEPMDVDRVNDTDSLDGAESPTQLCILCRDEQIVDFKNQTMVLLAYVQRSAVLSKNRNERRIPNYSLTPSNQLKHRILLSSQQPSKGANSSQPTYSYTSDNGLSFDATFMPSDLFFGPHISTCGHVMHYDCWEGFFDAVTKREHNRTNRHVRPVSYELEKREILCPLCECISNATIPLLPNYTRFNTPSRKLSRCIFPIGQEVIEKSSENLSACLNALRSVADTFQHIRHIKDLSSNESVSHEDKYMRLLQPKALNDVLEDLDEKCALSLRSFILAIRTHKISSNSCNRTLLRSVSTLAQQIHRVGLDLDNSITDVHHSRIFMMTSWSIAYTIQSFERVSRFRGSPILEELESSKNLCLGSLMRFACASMMTHQSDMVQSLLIRKLRFLLVNEEHLSSSPCCLDIDAFETFVSITILLQKLYSHLDEIGQIQSTKLQTAPRTWFAKGPVDLQESKTSENYAWTTQAYDHEYFRNILHLMVILNLLQVIISIQNERTLYGDNHLTDDLSNLSVESSASSNDNTANKTTPSSASPQNAQSLEGESSFKEAPASSAPKDCYALQSFYKDVILSSGHPNSKIPIVQEEFCTKIKHRLLPFLRSCAMFFYHLSRIPPPDPLRKKSAFFEGKDFVDPKSRTDASDKKQNDDGDSIGDAEEFQEIDLEATELEYNAICSYLALPQAMNLLLNCQEARHLARSWLRHSRVLPLIESALNERSNSKSKEPKTEAGSSSSSNLSGPSATGAKFSPSPAAQTTASSSASAAASASASASVLTSTTPSSTSMATSTTLATNTDLMPVKFIRQPHSVNRLVDLPYDYSELVDKVSDFSCPNIKNEDSRTPTMCLVCGLMLCSQSYCCQRDLNELASNYQQIVNQQTTLAQLVGSCTYHALECSAGVGVFLRIRNCQVLLISGRAKGCYMPAPYIDDHGETDYGLLRGNPLHLNRQLYEKLQQMWLTHAIPEQISRTLEYSPHAAGIGWLLH